VRALPAAPAAASVLSLTQRLPGVVLGRIVAMVVTAPVQMRMRQVERNGIVVLRPEGELDTATAPALRDRLARLDGKRVRVDLGGVTFLSSAGLAVLLEAAGSVTFYRARADVERTLRLSGISRLLRYEP
jgi:anti-anti-sigma factor